MKGSILLYGGEVHTVNERDEIAQALLLRGDRIAYVGTEAGARLLADSSEQVREIDLRGRAVVPGFVDAHIRMTTAGLTRGGRLDISQAGGVESVEDLLARVRQAAAALPPDKWVLAAGYSPEHLKERRHPTRVELDAAAPKNPVLVLHAAGAMCVANTDALEQGGVLVGEGEHPAHVIRDADGEPTGLLIESAYFDMLRRAPIHYSDDALLEGLERYQRRLAECGVTSAHDSGGLGADTFRTLQKARDTGRLTCRCYPLLWTLFGKRAQKELVAALIAGGFYTGLGDSWLKKGPIKLMVDGSAASGTCATRAPLTNGRQYEPAFTQQELDEIVLAAHQAHFQIAAQAMGDRAIEMVLNAYEKALTRYPRPDHRHRIEHCFLCPPDLVARMVSLGVIPVSNPGSIAEWGKVYGRFYGERCSDIFPLQRYWQAGVVCPFGSDAPTVPPDPLFGMAAAMERMDLASGDLIAGGQALTVQQALRCATYYGAYAAFDEAERGSLQPGRSADVVVLSDSLLDKDAAGVRRLSVELTILGGRVIFERGREDTE